MTLNGEMALILRYFADFSSVGRFIRFIRSADLSQFLSLEY